MQVGQRGEYKSGVAAIYTHTKATVIPVALNTGLFWPKGSFTKLPGTCIIEFLPAVPQDLSKDEFMRYLENEIETHCNKLLN
jgi:1-acyl-sn-glycerol-3-phosphate acyltransferase